MDRAACIDFANAHPICFLATSDQGGPRVRPLLLWFADEDGFTFMTMSPNNSPSNCTVTRAWRCASLTAPRNCRTPGRCA